MKLIITLPLIVLTIVFSSYQSAPSCKIKFSSNGDEISKQLIKDKGFKDLVKQSYCSSTYGVQELEIITNLLIEGSKGEYSMHYYDVHRKGQPKSLKKEEKKCGLFIIQNDKFIVGKSNVKKVYQKMENSSNESEYKKFKSAVEDGFITI